MNKFLVELTENVDREDLKNFTKSLGETIIKGLCLGIDCLFNRE